MREIANTGAFFSLLSEYWQPHNSIRLGVTGCSGCGKTVMIKAILREVLLQVQTWIFTTKRVDGYRGTEIRSLTSAEELIFRNVKGHYIIHDIGLYQSLAPVFFAARNLRMLVIDEAHNILLESDNAYWKVWRRIFMEGRALGCGVLWSTQSPSYCDPVVRRNSGGLCVGVLSDPADRRYMRMDPKLYPSEFYRFRVSLPKGETGLISSQEIYRGGR